MGMPARIPWIAFVAPAMQVSNGFYPVYLYYKELDKLILAYGISETEACTDTWPYEIKNNNKTITAYLNADVSRYGDSYVFKAYKVKLDGDIVTYFQDIDGGREIVQKEIESDLENIIDYYKKTVSIESSSPSLSISQSAFVLEKHLEDFLIGNWSNTELGKRFDLIIEDGELISQQYRTEIGHIDILARDKNKKNYVVIELKKNQTSDDTIGQLARYMGWISEKMSDDNVRGIIIAGDYDRRLEYALKMIPNVEVFIYQVDFKLTKYQ